MDNKILLNPYIFFQGNCREAMEFYKSIFGGELATSSYDDVPGPAISEDLKGKLMHAHLSGGDITLMGSDTEGASAKAAKVTISLGGSNEEKLRSIFEKLSDGITPESPLKKEMWGDIFGQLTDRYGVDWMVNISVPKEA